MRTIDYFEFHTCYVVYRIGKSVRIWRRIRRISPEHHSKSVVGHIRSQWERKNVGQSDSATERWTLHFIACRQTFRLEDNKLSAIERIFF